MAPLPVAHARAMKDLSLILSKAFADAAEVFRRLEADEPLAEPAQSAQVAPVRAAAIAAPPPPRSLDMGAAELARRLKMTRSNVYRLLTLGRIQGAYQEDSGAWKISMADALAFEQRYKKGVHNSPQLSLPTSSAPLPPPAPAAKPVAKPAPKAEPPKEEGFDYLPQVDRIERTVGGLEEEIKELQEVLESEPREQLVAQLNTWAAMYRKANEQIDELTISERKTPLRLKAWSVIKMLRELADKHGVVVRALQMDWTFPDWALYIKAHSHPRPALTHEEEQKVQYGDLRYVVANSRTIPKEMLREIKEAASKIVNHADIHWVKAEKIFEAKLKEEAPAEPPKAQPIEVKEAPPPEAEIPVESRRSEIPAEVLEITRGKRVVVIGGNRSQESRVEDIIESFDLSSCEWFAAEKGKSLGRYMSRITPVNYDMMIYLAHMTGHQLMPLQTKARVQGIPIVMLSKGYGITSIAQAIKEQLGPRKVALRPFRGPVGGSVIPAH